MERGLIAPRNPGRRGGGQQTTAPLQRLYHCPGSEAQGLARVSGAYVGVFREQGRGSIGVKLSFQFFGSQPRGRAFSCAA